LLVTALSGGVGGSKLVLGLSKLLKHGELVAIGNTGDDLELFGLHISPDLDILMYTLAGIVDEQRGWGVKNDTFVCLNALGGYYGLEKWFNLGDKDLATHIHRTQLLRKGYRLSDVTEMLCTSLGLNGIKIIPMTDDKVETIVKVQDGSMISFQEYFVKRGCRDEVTGVNYDGSRTARPPKRVLDSIENSDLVVICPSNPIASIGPILSVRNIREALRKATCPVVAVSPIIRGKPVKGPADKFMRGLGLEVSPLGIAKFYEELIDYLVIDDADADLEKEVKLMGLDTLIARTMMSTEDDKVSLARTVLNLLKKGRDS
jgi:LPPG:FO 2-phospho-L-lactate transferase